MEWCPCDAQSVLDSGDNLKACGCPETGSISSSSYNPSKPRSALLPNEAGAGLVRVSRLATNRLAFVDVAINILVHLHDVGSLLV